MYVDFNAESNSPTTTLAATFDYLSSYNANTNTKYHDIFAKFVAEDAPYTLLGFSEDADEQLFIVCLPTSSLYPDPRIY